MQSSIKRPFRSLARAIVTSCVAFGALSILPGSAGASTLTAIPFGDGAWSPTSGLAADASGNLYGTTYRGGTGNNGVVFELIRGGDGSFTYKTLYTFCPEQRHCNQALPKSKLVVDVNGNLYGTTAAFRKGGGSVFELSPNADRSVWTLNILHKFCGNVCSDPWSPQTGLTYAGAASGALYDGVSPLYGTTRFAQAGSVFKIAPAGGTGHWRVTVLHFFNGQDGDSPGALMIDGRGVLYGTTNAGGSNQAGTVFALSPGSKKSWTFSVLYNFCSTASCADGGFPVSDLIEDAAGNLFGTTSAGGSCGVSNGCGVAFKLSEGKSSWQEHVLYNFCSQSNCTDGAGPSAGLVMDGEGNLFGATSAGGNQNASGGTAGVLYKLPAAGGEQVLYSFCSDVNVDHCLDGATPVGDLLLDASGNLFGVTMFGGSSGSSGTAYEFSP